MYLENPKKEKAMCLEELDCVCDTHLHLYVKYLYKCKF